MIAGKKQEAVLNCQRGDPEVVRWNGRSLVAQLGINLSVMVCRLEVWKKHPDSRPVQETDQNAFILTGQLTGQETCFEFGKNYERNKNPFSLLQNLFGQRICRAEIPITIGVQEQLHFQISESVRRRLTMASSNPLAFSTQEPDKSSRS